MTTQHGCRMVVRAGFMMIEAQFVCRCARRLQALLSELDGGSYAAGIDWFVVAIHAGFDHKFKASDASGLSNVRHYASKGFISCDVLTPTTIWRESMPAVIRVFLAEHVMAAFVAFADRLEKKHVAVNREALLGDVQARLAQFVRDEGLYPEAPAEQALRKKVEELSEAVRRQHAPERSVFREPVGQAPAKYFRACSMGRLLEVAAFLRSGVDPNARDTNFLTGLMWAGRKGNVDVARLLLDHGASIDMCDVRGRTALFHAACFDRNEFIEFLATRGANLSPIDTLGCTPLDIARYSEKPKLQTAELIERLGGVANRQRRGY